MPAVGLPEILVILLTIGVYVAIGAAIVAVALRLLGVRRRIRARSLRIDWLVARSRRPSFTRPVDRSRPDASASQSRRQEEP